MTMCGLKVILAAGVVGFLSACTTARPRVSIEGAQVIQNQRDKKFESQENFHLRGRIAIKNAQDGGSGRFEWTQNGERIEFELSAPLSNQTWRLEGQPGSYTLTDSKGTPQHGEDARQLIYSASNWIIPMQELRFWVRGARAITANGADAQLNFDATGRLSVLKQNGWTVNYERFTDATDDALPVKLRANKDDAQVRVIVQSWE